MERLVLRASWFMGFPLLFDLGDDRAEANIPQGGA
jgi:hypothetical protein